jgi:hypothetical protein
MKTVQTQDPLLATLHPRIDQIRNNWSRPDTNRQALQDSGELSRALANLITSTGEQPGRAEVLLDATEKLVHGLRVFIDRVPHGNALRQGFQDAKLLERRWIAERGSQELKEAQIAFSACREVLEPAIGTLIYSLPSNSEALRTLVGLVSQSAARVPELTAAGVDLLHRAKALGDAENFAHCLMKMAVLAGGHYDPSRSGIDSRLLAKLAIEEVAALLRGANDQAAPFTELTLTSPRPRATAKSRLPIALLSATECVQCVVVGLRDLEKSVPTQEQGATPHMTELKQLMLAAAREIHDLVVPAANAAVDGSDKGLASIVNYKLADFEAYYDRLARYFTEKEKQSALA